MRARRRPLMLGLAVLAATLTTADLAPASSVKSVLARLCRRTFNVQGRLYALKRQGLLLACADKVLKCELLLEVDGVNPSDCRSSATASCAGRLGTDAGTAMSKVQLRFDTKVGAVCLSSDLTYADILSPGPGGLWFGNDTTCGSAIDLPSMVACVRGEVEATVDGVVSTLKPRTGVLLDNVGLGASYPNLVRPPAVDVLVAATAPGSGVLVNPGTVNVPLGNALRFTGDVGTLACSGSGSNGKVTITVGSGPTAQQVTLDEPYAAGEVAIFGAFTSAGTLPYTLDYKDGSCQDVVSGTVSVP